MGQRPSPFTEADVRRAINGAQKAGWTVKSVEICRDGTIRVIPSAANDSEPLDDYEEVDLG
jgi:hypothetical protein